MSMVVNILENFLGEPISHYESKSQIGFDCPMCAIDKGKPDGDGKGNLAVNYEMGFYKCWACYDRNNMHGPIIKLIRKFGNKQHVKDYLLVAPKFTYTIVESDGVPDIVKLPKDFKKFSESTLYDDKYKDAYAYVKARGLTDKMIKKYGIGWVAEDLEEDPRTGYTGKFTNRIIIPSYDAEGKLNYFMARAFYEWAKIKYRNPDAEKKLIIFNENKVNWDSTIYLVEGAFDHIVTPNSIPLMGKFMTDKLFYTLQMKAKGNIVIVLDGGEEEREDARFLYKKLNTLNLYNKIRIVDIKDDWDLSKIYEVYGPKTILNYLRTAYKIKESRL